MIKHVTHFCFFTIFMVHLDFGLVFNFQRPTFFSSVDRSSFQVCNYCEEQDIPNGASVVQQIFTSNILVIFGYRTPWFRFDAYVAAIKALVKQAITAACIHFRWVFFSLPLVCGPQAQCYPFFAASRIGSKMGQKDALRSKTRLKPRKQEILFSVSS